MAEALAKWNLKQVDLSYLNGPDINAMGLQGGHRNIDSYIVNWSHILPPVECLEKLFVTKDGLSIQEVIQQLTEVGDCVRRIQVSRSWVHACKWQCRVQGQWPGASALHSTMAAI